MGYYIINGPYLKKEEADHFFNDQPLIKLKKHTQYNKENLIDFQDKKFRLPQIQWNKDKNSQNDPY